MVAAMHFFLRYILVPFNLYIILLTLLSSNLYVITENCNEGRDVTLTQSFNFYVYMLSINYYCLKIHRHWINYFEF